MAKDTKNQKKVVARNKRATHDYFILDTLECGIVLVGTEIKSVRANKVSIQESYCQIKKGTLYIFDMHIGKYDKGNIFNHEETRDRVLLAHKKEISDFEKKIKLMGYTLIPLKVYFDNRGKCKVLVGLCRGKHNYDKRQTEKEKQVKRDIARVLKN